MGSNIILCTASAICRATYGIASVQNPYAQESRREIALSVSSDRKILRILHSNERSDLLPVNVRSSAYISINKRGVALLLVVFVGSESDPQISSVVGHDAPINARGS